MEHEPKGSGEMEQVTVQWVMEARHSNTEAAKVGSEASIIPPPTKPNFIPTVAELPLSLSIAPSANVARGHNGIRLEIVSLYKR